MNRPCFSCGPYNPMNLNIAKAVRIDVSQVNVKATTEEGLGFTGTGEGISSQAVCLLTSPFDLSAAPVPMGCAGCSGCAGAGHVFDPERRKVATRLLVDDANPSQKSYLLEIVDNPVGVKAIVPT